MLAYFQLIDGTDEIALDGLLACFSRNASTSSRKSASTVERVPGSIFFKR
jgi:hypothetical protein